MNRVGILATGEYIILVIMTPRLSQYFNGSEFHYSSQCLLGILVINTFNESKNHTFLFRLGIPASYPLRAGIWHFPLRQDMFYALRSVIIFSETVPQDTD